MARYSNGQVPESLLVRRPARNGSCWMMPGTAYKHDRFVALSQAERGWTPRVSGPDDAYRRLHVQEEYFETEPPGMAAYPGSSSHGGDYDFEDGRGRVEQGAVDYGNWEEVGREVFFDLARRAGFVPGVFDGNGVPDEPWHVFDPTPWLVPTPPPAPLPEEEDTMQFLIINGIGTARHYVSLGIGVFRHFIQSDPYDKIMRIGRARDDWQPIEADELPAALRTWGCDLRIWDWRPASGGFCVLDPLDGSVKPGNMWSAANAARSQIAQLPTLITRQTAAYEAELARTKPYEGAAAA